VTFDEAVRSYGDWLRMHAWRRATRLGLDVDEAMQEGWLLIWLNWHAVQSTDRPGGLMKKLLDQAITLMWRTRIAVKRGGTGLRVERQQAAPTHSEIEDWDRPISGGQEDAVELSQVMRALDGLSPLLRDTLITHAKGDTLTEIADHAGVSRQAIDNRIDRAREQLGKALKIT
jgi:RNA polymerase sigma factor (sigma-70 family)